MLPGLPSAPQWAHGSWQHRSRALKRKRHDSSQFISMTYDMTFIGRKVFKKHQKTIKTLYQTLVGGELLGWLGTSIPKTPCSFLSQPPSSNFRHLLQSLKRWRKPEEMQGNTSLKSPRVSQSAPSNLKLISPWQKSIDEISMWLRHQQQCLSLKNAPWLPSGTANLMISCCKASALILCWTENSCRDYYMQNVLPLNLEAMIYCRNTELGTQGCFWKAARSKRRWSFIQVVKFCWLVGWLATWLLSDALRTGWSVSCYLATSFLIVKTLACDFFPFAALTILFFWKTNVVLLVYQSFAQIAKHNFHQLGTSVEFGLQSLYAKFPAPKSAPKAETQAAGGWDELRLWFAKMPWQRHQEGAMDLEMMKLDCLRQNQWKRLLQHCHSGPYKLDGMCACVIFEIFWT